MAVILLIEDEVSYRTSISNLLEAAGHSIVLANNGIEASKMLSQWKNRAPDIVITDHKMPGMTGYEFVRTFRRETLFAKVPIVVLTAMAKQVKALAEEEGVVVLDKLTPLQDIMALIAGIVEKLPKPGAAPADKPLEIKRGFY